MSGQTELFTAAALLERAYRLALVLQSEGLREFEYRQFVAAELAEVLDEARVALLVASGFHRPV